MRGASYPRPITDAVRRDEIVACVDLAVRCRQRVVTELGKIAPSEFRGIILEARVA